MTKSLLALLVFASLAHAQAEYNVPAPAMEETFDFVTQVPIPGVGSGVVSDVHQMLAFGNRKLKEPTLTVYKIDDKGEIGSQPDWKLPLPFPDEAPVDKQYVLSLVFHPKLPLLYVWQCLDYNLAKGYFPSGATLELEHLLIFDFSGKEPKLVFTGCKGDQYAIHCAVGDMAFDITGKKLFIPNMAAGNKAIGFGVLNLKDNGLPMRKGNELDVSLVPKTAVLGVFAMPASIIPINEQTALVAGPMGVATWDMRGFFNYLHILDNPAPFRMRMRTHNAKSMAYVSLAATPVLYSIEHAEGYFTLGPKRVLLEGVALNGGPAALSKRNLVAVSSTGNKLILVGLDEKGHVTSQRRQSTIINLRGHAMVYSNRFDRLYLPVEKLK